LAIAEYWRWWVVHLGVEGFFEVFATVVIAFLFTRMGIVANINVVERALGVYHEGDNVKLSKENKDDKRRETDRQGQDLSKV
jgi:hypothetical protein